MDTCYICGLIAVMKCGTCGSKTCKRHYDLIHRGICMITKQVPQD